ncbi:MAG: nicotinate-nucleotide adenylyltransferase [Lachnospiraceae bacterium]|nr:nicotinate-nucleotide adenylyltransferase [Lachnospiraceae bacterium]
MGRKIGIMGGTFNPIHTGHLILGEAAYTELGLDLVWYMPAGNPPHKRILSVVSDEDRVEMVKAAISENEHFELSLHEMNEDGFTYTYRTLESLKEMEPDAELYFIMGGDSIFDFEKWREPARIAAACTIVVATRNHVKADALNAHIAHLVKRFGADIRLLDTPNIDIASSEIREKVLHNQSIRYYVPDRVRDYIYRKGLYTRPE